MPRCIVYRVQPRSHSRWAGVSGTLLGRVRVRVLILGIGVTALALRGHTVGFQTKRRPVGRRSPLRPWNWLVPAHPPGTRTR